MTSTEGLNWVIFRPAIVYGPGDVTGITPRLIIAAVYQELKEEMKLLWTGDLRINTVHVKDVVKAVTHVVSKGVKNEIFNLSDKGETGKRPKSVDLPFTFIIDQNTMNKIIEDIFKIKTGFHGSIISNLARLNFSQAVEDSNEKHLQPWSELCKKSNCQLVLTPYLDQELLLNNSLSVDGSKIETSTGFNYSYQKISTELIREVLDHFVKLEIFPISSLSSSA